MNLKKGYSKMLKFEDIKEKIDTFVEGIEIDEEDLSSAYYEGNPYCVEPELVGTSGCWMYDEDEYYEAQLEKAKEYIEEGIENYIDMPADEPEENIRKLQEEAIDYLDNLIGGLPVFGV